MTPHIQMLPGRRKSGSSPCHPLLVGRILIFQQAGNKDSKSQKVSDPKMPIITPAILTLRREKEGLVYSLANLPRTLYTDAQHVHYTHILEYLSWMQLIKPSFMDKMDSDIKPVELPSRKNFLKRICFLMRPDFTQANTWCTVRP